MAKKNFLQKYLAEKNILTMLKAILVGIVSSVIGGFLMFIGNLVHIWAGYTLGVISFLFTWGYLANTWWKWK